MRRLLLFLICLVIGCAHRPQFYCDGSPRPRLAPVISVRAQSSQPGLTVLILDRVTSAPVQGAQVMVRSQGIIVVSDSNGLAQSRTIAPGLANLVVRSLGYRAVRDTLAIPEHPGRFLIVQIEAEPSCIQEIGQSPTHQRKPDVKIEQP
jgi:hypothetical protein